MTFVEDILRKMKEISKPQFKFLKTFFSAMLICSGKATMSHLERFGAGSRQRIARWNKREFDFFELNSLAIKEHAILKHRTAIAFDASFLPKSGKKTFGLGMFFNATQSRPQRGLEISSLACLDLDENTAYNLCSFQTPPEMSDESTRMDYYTSLITTNSQKLKELGKHIVVDGGLTRKKLVDGACHAGLHVVGKLRHDSDLRTFYQGSQKEGRGRPKKYDKKVDYSNLFGFEKVHLKKEEVCLYSSWVNHKSLKRDILAVIVRFEAKKKRRHVVLFSTDRSQTSFEVFEMYKARFQIEFLFRDGKQHTGLCDGQMRDKEGLIFHINSSMSTVNFLRLEDRERQNVQGPRVISLASWKRRKYNQKLMNLILSELGNGDDFQLNQELTSKCLNFGSIAA